MRNPTAITETQGGNLDLDGPLPAFVSRAQAAHLLGLSLSTYWRGERAGTLPAAVRLTEGRVGIPVEQLRKWRDAKIATSV